MSIVQDLVPLFAANAHALRYFDQKKQKWNYRKIGRPIEPALITQHISRGDPEFSLGAYVLRDLENSKGHALILDLDDHDGDAGALITETAVKLCGVLEDLALPYLLFQSGGGKGFHVYLLFEELQTKSWLRALGKHLVYDKLGLEEGTKGVSAGQIEIFPKGDGFGGENVIALPLARKSVALRREGESFVETTDPTEIPFCPVLTQISDPGYGVAPKDNRVTLLGELLGYADMLSFAALSFDPVVGDFVGKEIKEPLSPALLLQSETPLAGYFPIEKASDKGHVVMIRTPAPARLSAALGEYK